MHDVLRQRLMRKIESLPEDQIYQVLDYIEFLESKYAMDLTREASGLQRFAEGVEDKLRKKAMSPATLREAFQIISAADKVLARVSNAGKQLMEEITGAGEDQPESGESRTEARKAGSPPADEERTTSTGEDGVDGPK